MTAAGSESGRAAHDGTRFELVDAMRALAAFSVLVFHMTFLYAPPDPDGLWGYLSQRNAGPPVPGVVLFFVISGFVLYRPFVKARLEGAPAPALVPYAVRRFARIVPAYWVALAIVTMWLGLQEVQSVNGVIRYFGFLQLYGPVQVAEGGIGPAWTLCVEVTFYASVPLLAWLIRRVARRRAVIASELWLCAALAALSVAWQLAIIATTPVSDPWLLPLLWMLPGSLGMFAVGMTIAVASVAVARRPEVPGWVALIDRAPWLPWVAALGCFYAIGQLPSLQDIGFAAWWVPSVLLKAIAGALLLAPLVFGTLGRGRLRRAAGWRPLIWLGAISYSVYLWHTPLRDKIAPHVAEEGQLALIAAVAVATVAVSALSYYAIERPAQRLARRRLARRAEPVAAPLPATVAEPEPVRTS